MKELFPIEADNLPIEVKQGTMPIPAEGKRLYITQDPKASALPTALHPVMKFSDCGQIWGQRRFLTSSRRGAKLRQS